MSTDPLEDPVDRPPMPAAPRPLHHADATPASRPRMTFGAIPDDVAETLRDWGEESSATAVVVLMVRHLREARYAALRARIQADAIAYDRDRRRRS